MSDSSDDRRHRGGRGSLLDHARGGRSSTAGQPVEPVRPNQTSILSASNRSARVSTRHSAPAQAAQARKADPLLTVAPAPDAAPAPRASAAASSIDRAPAGRERFGDRISRLIGAIAPEDNPQERPSAQREQVSTEPAAPREAGAERVAPSHQAIEPERTAASRDVHADAYRGDDHRPGYRYPAPVSDRYGYETRPLLDASIMISAVWRFRRLIVAFTVLGAVLGVLFALSTPHKYYAESRLFVDPREIRVTEDDIRNQQLSTEAMLAITDSQLQILSSTSVLETVVADLGLDRDPEFNGSLSSGGISGGLTLIKQILSGKNATDEGEQKALNKLRDALSVFRDAKTFVIIVGVSTRDAEKSALIANQIVETYLDSEGQAQSNLLERTSESIDTRINSLRADLDAAEREVERFKAENGLVGVGGEYIDDKVILALSDQLANARAMKVGIRVKADNLAKVNINDVLSGAFPEELLSANLSELRKQYTQTKSNAESLATRLGPRHPQYIGAMQSLKTITNEISAELRRIVASSQTELQRAVETEQELASQMAVAKSRAMDQSVELVTLRELERKANATRGIYEAFLTRSRETSERSNLSTRNVRVISPAEAPIQPMGPSRKIIAIAGMMSGLFAGLGLALLVGAIDSIRAYNGAQSRGDYGGSPSGGYPEPPHPGPGTDGGRGYPRRPGRNEDMAGQDRGHDHGMGDVPANAYSAAGAMFSDNSASDSPVSSEPVRTGLFRPKWARRSATAESSGISPGTDARYQPTAADEQLSPPVTGQGPAAGRTAQAFMHGHAQPHSALPEAAPAAGQAPTPSTAPFHARDQYGTPPAFVASPAPLHPQAAYPQYPHPLFQPGLPAHPQMMQQVQPVAHPAALPQSYPAHSPYMGEPHAPVHPGGVSGYPDPRAAHYAAAASYSVPQHQMMPAQQVPMPPQIYPPQAFPPQDYQPVPSPAHNPVVQPHPVQTHTTPEPQPAQSPADNDHVDRIRREMDELRARIDGYGSRRQRA